MHECFGASQGYHEVRVRVRVRVRVSWGGWWVLGGGGVFFSHSFWTLMDVPAGVTQEEGNTGFSIHLLSAVGA